MADPVTYAAEGSVALVTMDDGKANALTFDMFAGLSGALDQAEADGVAVVVAGRPGRFSAGFDLKVLGTVSEDAARLLRTGFEMAHRLLSFPLPIVVVCTGHAYAMGSFLLLCGDHRFGIAGGESTIVANEVRIGMTMPRAAIEIIRQRVPITHFERVTVLAEPFTPDTAVAAGYLDTIVAEGELLGAAQAKAVELMGLDRRAFAATKLRARAATLDALQFALEADDAEFRSLLP